MYIPTNNNQFPYPSFTRMAMEIAPSLGIQVRLVDPRHGYLLSFQKGKEKKYLLADVNPFNSHVASKLAKDKIYTNMLLEEAKIPIPKGDYFFLSERFSKSNYEQGKGIQEALKFAKILQYPFIAKPNQSSMGKNVALIHCEKDLEYYFQNLESTSPNEKIVLLQEFVQGREFRVILLDDQVLLALEKKTFSIQGDGKSKIKTLIQEKWETLHLNPKNLHFSFFEGKVSLCSILEKNKIILLDQIAYNMHRGATAKEILISDSIKKTCQKILRILGLRYGGIDLKINLENEIKTVLEVNSNAGFFQFAQSGKKEMKKAKTIYEKIFKKIF